LNEQHQSFQRIAIVFHRKLSPTERNVTIPINKIMVKWTVTFGQPNLEPGSDVRCPPGPEEHRFGVHGADHVGIGSGRRGSLLIVWLSCFFTTSVIQGTGKSRQGNRGVVATRGVLARM